MLWFLQPLGFWGNFLHYPTWNPAWVGKVKWLWRQVVAFVATSASVMELWRSCSIFFYSCACIFPFQRLLSLSPASKMPCQEVANMTDQQVAGIIFFCLSNIHSAPMGLSTMHCPFTRCVTGWTPSTLSWRIVTECFGLGQRQFQAIHLNTWETCIHDKAQRKSTPRSKVIYHLAGSPDIIQRLRQLGKRVFYVTNNSTKHRREYKTKVDKLGFGGELVRW